MDSQNQFSNQGGVPNDNQIPSGQQFGQYPPAQPVYYPPNNDQMMPNGEISKKKKHWFLKTFFVLFIYIPFLVIISLLAVFWFNKDMIAVYLNKKNCENVYKVVMPEIPESNFKSSTLGKQMKPDSVNIDDISADLKKVLSN